MKNLIYGLIGLLAIGGTAVGSFLGWNDDQESSYNIGDTVENFSLKSVNGQSVSFADIAGTSGSIIIFTCNTCPYAKLYEERILQIDDVYGDAGYPVILINPSDPDLKPGDQPAELTRWISTNNFNGAYLIDEDGLFHRFAALKTPEVFLLDKDKVLRYRGAIDNSAQGSESVTQKYLENAIRALENNEDPEPAETRPMGCVIKAE